MALTINHQTNDISATSGNVTLGGLTPALAAGGLVKVEVVATLPVTPIATTLYIVTG